MVGPRCLLSCLRTNTPVPEMPYPLYTAAMRGLNVSFTGLDAEQKKKYKVNSSFKALNGFSKSAMMLLPLFSPLSQSTSLRCWSSGCPASTARISTTA